MIKKLTVLNKSSIGNARTGTDDFTYVATIDLSAGICESNGLARFSDPSVVEVILEEDKKMEYTVGQKLKIHQSGGNDRSGSYFLLIEVKE